MPRSQRRHGRQPQTLTSNTNPSPSPSSDSDTGGQGLYGIEVHCRMPSSGEASSSTLKCTHCSPPKVTLLRALRLIADKAVLGDRTSRAIAGVVDSSSPEMPKPWAPDPARVVASPESSATSLRDRSGSTSGALFALIMIGVSPPCSDAPAASLALGDDTLPLPLPQQKERRGWIGRQSDRDLVMGCASSSSFASFSSRC
mmetsp:Transcript_110809/g.357567  ORF Transcript_110809/g.357567 Transcript_110809/m.357567 type:complete len:200 (+) Transcript_110809:81-680(+)